MLALGFFYFILKSHPLTRGVTCSVTLLGRKKYDEVMSDKHSQGVSLQGPSHRSSFLFLNRHLPS